MFNPLLDHPEFIYTRLTAVAWHANLSLRPTLFSTNAGIYLHQLIESEHPELPVLLNCAGISTIEDHALGQLRDYLLATERCVAFLVHSNNKQLAIEIDSELQGVTKSIESVGDHQIMFYGKSRDVVSPFQSKLGILVEDSSKLECEFARKAVGECYKSFKGKPEILDASTPLLATGILNARTLIADPKKFVWISLLLTDLFQQVIEEAEPKTNQILAISLRGSPFAAAIRILSLSFSPTLEIVDHIGPKHELLEGRIGRNEMYGGEYVLVSDFVIGGTEIKVARAYAIAQGATLKHAISIGAYLDDLDYGGTVKLRSLVSIPSAVPQLKYEFRSGAKK